VNDSDIAQIADYIEEIDPMIPWHVFRLLPEYRMADTERPNIESIAEALKKEQERLPFIYFSNFVGSRWMETACPACGEVVIKRINLGGCGAKCVENRIENGACPRCRTAVRCMEAAPLHATGKGV